ncbi:hypothetical protein [Parabacteroides provencensis]|uniref:hypothetical protein n=1 Tax=Parabacteroides provencensis TaxID=1944636 RepID=UPI001E3F7740|nr:hypothetical protein [Parabacteroides provencensis]
MKSSADNYQPSGRQLSTVWPIIINRMVDNCQPIFSSWVKVVFVPKKDYMLKE